MAAVSSIILAAGVATAAAGTYLQYQGSQRQRRASDEALQRQQEIDQTRQKQLKLDATRRKRELIRQQVAARSYALSTATNQGASQGSALPGAYGGISGRTNVDLLGINQNQELGNTIFGLNQGLLSAYQSGAQGQAMSGFGQGVTALGQGILNNIGTFTRVGTYGMGGGGQPLSLNALNYGGSYA